MHNESGEYDNASIIVRSLTDPKCTKVSIVDDKIKYEVEVQLGIELIGDTKVKISVDDNLDEYSIIEDEENIASEIETEVTDNYLENDNK